MYNNGGKMITFNQLWNNHPTIKGNDNPCSTNGKPNFPNQCSIRLGVCLQNSGIDTTRIPGIRHCWQHDKTAGHVLSAEEFANGLKRHSPFIPGIQNFQEIEPNEFSDLLAGNKGIIFSKIIGVEKLMVKWKALETEVATISIFGTGIGLQIGDLGPGYIYA